MKSKQIDAEKHTYVIALDGGDEFVGSLTRFALANHLGASGFTAIGAFERVTLGFYELDKREYRRNELNRQVEVVSLVGNIALDQGHPKIHAHAVVADFTGRAFGGHLLEGYVRPTLEIILTEARSPMIRRFDASSGLALLDLDEAA